MLIAIHGVMLYIHSYTWSEALCSLLDMDCVKLYANCYTWSEALWSMLYKE